MNLAQFCCFFTTIFAARHLVRILAFLIEKRKLIDDIAEIGLQSVEPITEPGY